MFQHQSHWRHLQETSPISNYSTSISGLQIRLTKQELENNMQDLFLLLASADDAVGPIPEE
jgi:hypothetical protein